MLQRKIRSYTLYEIFFYFLIYSCLGWIFETAYTWIDIGYFSDRGFLYSPACPIYGTSIVIAILAMDSIKKNIPALFVGGALLVTAIEYLTGTVLLEVFGRRWWNYTMFPYNLNGHVTLWISISWGAACVIIVRFLQPVVSKAVKRIDRTKGRAALAIIYPILLIDNVISGTQALMKR
ncbi:MAG: putative ABC transporter permease [Saccharofermentanales bacterium]